ncbi:MAG: multidrug ABC transporter substrate-binding protein [Hydrogenophilales bacterium 28-61-11]|nr:MAG: multidrug ABC transporter substrate-binding protein [Hydrogenophilales bacterium 28-61-11]OYZ56539.1 MAG: multidrug ABC transporter substrate-binding protein [Hydrogenophilales bacterium 16-61-112]
MFTSLFETAWHALVTHRMRSFLTMLGMVIGVAAVILMLAIGQGAQAMVRSSIESMGSNLFIIMSGATTSGGARVAGGMAPTLTFSDADAIRGLGDIVAAAPVSPGTAQLIYGGLNWNTSVYGTTPDYAVVRDWPMESGGFFSEADVRSGARVAVIGAVVGRELFGDEDPIGKIIRIRQAPFEVIGVLAAKGQSLDGRDQDDTVIVPITSAQQKIFSSSMRNRARLIMAQAVSDKRMDAAESGINELLRNRHRIGVGQDDDFTVRNLTALAETAASTTRIMSLLLGAIAAISLVVGGIGIMNIMLVSVTERTREIGIRMAIGARRRDVLWQFLIEALTLSLIGCAIGLGLGIGGAWLVGNLAGLPVAVTPASVLMAVGVSFLIGVFFGFYPARSAAGLDPIEALRAQ